LLYSDRKRCAQSFEVQAQGLLMASEVVAAQAVWVVVVGWIYQRIETQDALPFLPPCFRKVPE
jgi:hypothetical protein